MNKNSHFIFVLFGILYCLHLGQSFAGSVKCECPSISAKGTGNSSCSATENGGECIIDYNQFDPDIVNDAVSFVSQFSDRSIRYTFIKNSQELFQLSPDNLVDQLMVFMMVAVVQSRRSGIDENKLRNSFQSMHKNAHEIYQAFREMNGSYQSNGVYVTNGCVEIRTGNKFWAMYKNRLSKVAGQPQCHR